MRPMVQFCSCGGGWGGLLLFAFIRHAEIKVPNIEMKYFGFSCKLLSFISRIFAIQINFAVSFLLFLFCIEVGVCACVREETPTV